VPVTLFPPPDGVSSPQGVNVMVNRKKQKSFSALTVLLRKPAKVNELRDEANALKGHELTRPNMLSAAC
jgi:hypothetical protein